ncbi:hypothetical protein AVEN_6303-1 [Araneus ventricosus]|uniref:Uncharacterized protein n=1 Tax=Araneus ventricosus TaxID=182803 RepID=A0A4Y2K1J5_ARAVE|nr:hypothetical protein AVEN_6303-1 [Araneus ventricosus]
MRSRSTSSNSHSQKTQCYRSEDLGCQACGWDRQCTKFYPNARSLNSWIGAEMFRETPSFTIVTIRSAYPACDSGEYMTSSEAVTAERQSEKDFYLCWVLFSIVTEQSYFKTSYILLNI